MVQRAVNTKAKTGLRSTIIGRNSDIHCTQSHRPSNNTTSKVETHRKAAKDSSRPEKLKTKDLKLVSLYDDLAELAKKKDK